MAFRALPLFVDQSMLKASAITAVFKVKGQKPVRMALRMALRIEKAGYNAADDTYHFQMRSRQTNGLYIFSVKGGVKITGDLMGEPVQEA